MIRHIIGSYILIAFFSPVLLYGQPSIQWQKCFGGSNYDQGWGIVATSDGGYAMCGSTSSNDGDVSGNHGSSDFYKGYVKLNQISNCAFDGYLSADGDNPQIVFTSIQNCGQSGIHISGSSTLDEVDLTGIHEHVAAKPTPFHDIAAFDTISGNSLQTVGGQVLLDNVNFCMVDYGNLFPAWWTKWGENNTFYTTGSNGSLTNLLIAGVSGSPNIGSIDNNFWGTGINPKCTCLLASTGHWNPSDCTENDCTVGFTASVNGLDPETIVPFSVDCGGDLESIKHRDDSPLGLSKTVDIDTCIYLSQWRNATAQNEAEAIQEYDTVRLYIETCASRDNLSYQAFNHLDGIIAFYEPNDTTRFDRYRDWLISVLYLNKTNPAYFCSCIASIAGTYEYGKYHLPNAGLAVLNYLRSNSNCDGPGLEREYQQDIDARHTDWLDGDRKTPEDTILPSLDKIGLGFLLKGAVFPSIGSNLSTQYLASFTSSPNPFINETTLQFTLNRMTYITIAVYDELGRLVWGDGKGSSLEAGAHSVHIDGSKFPSGTLYARISTGFGVVKTIKLIHKK